MAGVTPGGSGLALQTTASLLASLTAPQAPVAPTATPDATTNPVAQITGGQAATPATTIATDIPANQDTFATSSSLDFALQTALRFGAGVAGQVAPANPGPLSEPGLVRDATAVLRTGPLQPQAGHPGPEAFTHPQATAQRVLRSYATAPAPTSPGSLDLMA